MIIDIHAHFPGLYAHSRDLDELSTDMAAMLKFGRSVGIDRQVLLALDYGEEANRLVKAIADRFPDELVPFVRGSCIDRECPAMVERCVEEYGFRGIKLHHELPLFPLTGLLAAHPLFDKAQELAIPILIHSWHQEEGLDALGPELVGVGSFPVSVIEELGRRYPGTTFILAHVGGMWVKAFQAAAPYPNLHFDVSGFDPERGIVETAVETLGAERVLFGSDVPGRSYAAQLAKVRYADISEEDRRLVLGENAAALLHLR